MGTGIGSSIQTPEQIAAAKKAADFDAYEATKEGFDAGSSALTGLAKIGTGIAETVGTKRAGEQALQLANLQRNDKLELESATNLLDTEDRKISEVARKTRNRQTDLGLRHQKFMQKLEMQNKRKAHTMESLGKMREEMGRDDQYKDFILNMVRNTRGTSGNKQQGGGQ